MRPLHVPALVAAALLLGTLGAAPADAGKPPPPPQDLAAGVTAHEGGTYDVAATWEAVATATSYKVALTKGGSTLASTTVSSTSWSPTVSATPGNASLTVRALVGRKQGKPATTSVPLPDVTAPTGSYSSSWDNNTGDATITQDSLADDSGGAVTRTVDWGDGESGPWASGVTTTHTYPTIEARYEPTVTLEDAAGNVRVVEVPAIVINDAEDPTGTFVNDAPTAWAKLTPVTVSQSAIGDNWTPAEMIARSVDWGDGTITEWTAGDTTTHVYTAAGAYTPTVTITDEAGNSADVATTEVVVTVDTTGPVLKLTVPSAKHSVKAWRTLRGKARDTQTGVKTVRVRAVEQRGRAWYGYNAAAKKWRKAATKAKAFVRSRPFLLKTDARNRWSGTLVGLQQGTLVYQARAIDRVANQSPLLTQKAKLTRR